MTFDFQSEFKKTIMTVIGSRDSNFFDPGALLQIPQENHSSSRKPSGSSSSMVWLPDGVWMTALSENS